MKSVLAALMFSAGIFITVVNLLSSPEWNIPDNAKFFVLVGGFMVWCLGVGLIAERATDTSKLTPEQLRRRGDVGCFTFVFLPVVMAMFAFAFIVLPALAGAK